MTNHEAVEILTYMKNAYSKKPNWALDMAIQSLKEQRPQGEWINKRTIKHDGEFYCSNCDFELESFIQGAFYNFCPNCGADMRGGAE